MKRSGAHRFGGRGKVGAEVSIRRRAFNVHGANEGRCFSRVHGDRGMYVVPRVRHGPTIS